MDRKALVHLNNFQFEQFQLEDKACKITFVFSICILD
jgi:hypothetical protein